MVNKTIKPNTALLQQAIAHHQAGRLQQAEHIYQQIIEVEPENANAYHFLGVIAHQVGKNDIAVQLISKSIAKDSNQPFFYSNLGNVLKEQGKLDDATQSYQRALSINPDYAEAHNNLGNVVKEQGKLDDAIQFYQRALSINPDLAEVHYNLGFVLHEQDKLDNAIQSYQRALSINPDLAEAHHNLGNVLKEQNKFDDAIQSYQRALSINPDLAEAHNNLGGALQEQGKLDDAIQFYQRALSVNPDYAEAHNNLGVALHEQGKFDDAIQSYQRALSIKPKFAEAHSNLGNTFQVLGSLDEALGRYAQALGIKPDEFSYAFNARLIMPPIQKSQAAVDQWRRRFVHGINVLKSELGVLKNIEKDEVTMPSFYLAYHNMNDRQIMEMLCGTVQKRVLEVTATSPHVPVWTSPHATGRSIRLGIISNFFSNHTIGKLYQGLVRNLDRRNFHVTVFHAPQAKLDGISKAFDSSADRVIKLPAHLAAQQKVVAAKKMDVLFYPDIGMSSSTYFLAYARLAPVQVVSWGHPNTTGLDSIDYFLSAADIEPENAMEHYTEQLVCLNRLPCYYQAFMAPTGIPSRAVLGLPETGTLYGCPQSLFKFHPEFDAVLASIAEGDPGGHLVLVEGTYAVWTETLKARWARTHPILLDRVLFLPRMSLDKFMAMIAHMDILLDPIHFGSGNTLYEAMVYGVPVVTWPGKFARGRIVSAAYRQMKISDPPIAQSIEAYAPLALALAQDRDRRQALRKELLDAAPEELFSDMQAVREFEAFFVAAVDAAGRGEKLPTGWRPTHK